MTDQQPTDVQYDSDTETFHATFDPTEDHPVSVTVVEAVATVAGTTTLDLEPLYDRVNPDALNALFDSAADDDHGNAYVDFSLEGYDVTVRADGRIEIQDD